MGEFIRPFPFIKKIFRPEIKIRNIPLSEKETDAPYFILRKSHELGERINGEYLITAFISLNGENLVQEICLDGPDTGIPKDEKFCDICINKDCVFAPGSIK